MYILKDRNPFQDISLPDGNFFLLKFEIFFCYISGSQNREQNIDIFN